MTIQSCLLCWNKENGIQTTAQEWGDRKGLLYLKDNWKICPKHLGEIDARIAELPREPIKYTLKAAVEKMFVPKDVPSPKNFQDREPNDGSLIE